MDSVLLARGKTGWRSPPEILEPVYEFFGGFPDLDPCGSPDGMPIATYTLHGSNTGTDGLKVSWSSLGGTAYANPPYSSTEKGADGKQHRIELYREGDEIAYVEGVSAWVEKAKSEMGVESILLVAARPDTQWFQRCGASRVCFWEGRLVFVGAPTSAPFPSALLYYGLRTERFEQVFESRGVVVPWVKR